MVRAAIDAPDTLVDVAKESIAEDVAAMKRAKDEAQRELESLRARLAALEASLTSDAKAAVNADESSSSGDAVAPFSDLGTGANNSGDAIAASEPIASKVREAPTPTPTPPRSPSRRWTEGARSVR